MSNSSYIKERLKYVNLSLFDPDYILKKEIIKFFPKNKFEKVLDYGAGNSPWKKFILSENYCKADISQNVNKDIDMIIQTGKPVPLKGSNFDLVLLMDVLAHTPSFDFTIKECNRLLKKNAHLIISVPFIYRENETPFDYFRPTSFGIVDVLHRNNFKISEIKKVGNIAFTIFSLVNERNIKNGEKNKQTFFGKVVNKLLMLLTPIFNKSIFLSSPNYDDGIYHHLLVSAIKKHEI